MIEQNKSTLIKISDLDRQDSKGNTLLHWAAEAGDVDLVQALIDHKVRVGLSNFAGETPFSKAASAGHLDVIKVFEKAGYEWRSDRSYQGQTPLYQAAKNGHLPVVMYLANQGAYLDVPSQTDMPLHVAIKNNHLDVASFLICEGAMPDYQDKKGQTPAALLVDKLLNDKVPHPRKTMALFRCLSLLMEKGVNVRIGAQEMMDLKDYYEGAAEKLDTTFVPLGHKKPRLIQKGHRTQQFQVGLQNVQEWFMNREG